MNEIDDLELEEELFEAGRDHSFWPDLIPNQVRMDLLTAPRESREKVYIQQAEYQHKALLEFEKTNRCMPFISRFEHVKGVLMLFQSPWSRRFKACPDYVEAAFEAWIGAFTLREYRRHWLRFFDRKREEVRKSWMTAEELAVLQSLPKPFTLYRGYNKPYGKNGLSWTLDIRTAAKIPVPLGHNGVENIWIRTATANPENVIAYTDQRKEKEIIIDPKKILRIVKDEPVEQALEKEQVVEK